MKRSKKERGFVIVALCGVGLFIISFALVLSHRNPTTAMYNTVVIMSDVSFLMMFLGFFFWQWSVFRDGKDDKNDIQKGKR